MKSGGTLTAAGNNRIHREHFDIYLLVLSTEKGFEVGSKRVARSRESKRFERRITKGTKYFDEVWKSFMNELLWGLNDWFESRGMDGGSGGQRP